METFNIQPDYSKPIDKTAEISDVELSKIENQFENKNLISAVESDSNYITSKNANKNKMTSSKIIPEVTDDNNEL